MAFVRSLRDIPLDQEPHASVLAALTPVLEEEGNEEPESGEWPAMIEPQVPWHLATADQIAHLQICPACAAVLGGVGRVCIPANCDATSLRKEKP